MWMQIVEVVFQARRINTNNTISAQFSISSGIRSIVSASFSFRFQSVGIVISNHSVSIHVHTLFLIRIEFTATTYNCDSQHIKAIHTSLHYQLKYFLGGIFVVLLLIGQTCDYDLPISCFCLQNNIIIFLPILDETNDNTKLWFLL